MRVINYVDEAVEDLLSLDNQIGFVIDLMGGYDSNLDSQRMNFRAFLANILDQITKLIPPLADSRNAEKQLNATLPDILCLQGNLDDIKAGYGDVDHRLELAEGAISMIDGFVNDGLPAILDLKQEFVKAAEEIKRALAEAKNEARAQDTDHEGPNTEIKLTQVKS
jgi:Rad3-related DNA helicase